MTNQGFSKREDTLKYRKGHQESRFAGFGTRATSVSKNDEKLNQNQGKINEQINEIRDTKKT